MKRMRLWVTYVTLFALIFSLGSWLTPPTMASESTVQTDVESEQSGTVSGDETTSLDEANLPSQSSAEEVKEAKQSPVAQSDITHDGAAKTGVSPAEKSPSKSKDNLSKTKEDNPGSEQPGDQAPVIKVEGLTDSTVVSHPELAFSVTVSNKVDEAITPVVQLNGETVQPEAENRYRVSLREGENTVAARAKDRAGQEASRTFTISFQKRSQVSAVMVKGAVDRTSNYMLQKGVESEWEAIGLSLAGKQVPHDYEAKFWTNLDGQVLNPSRFAKITDIERFALAAQAIGLNPTNLNGNDIIAQIYNSADHPSGADTMTFQGLNGPIFALIALDSGNFNVPQDARWTRERLTQYIVEQQNNDGSWALSDMLDSPSYDITSMALIALAPYKEQDEKVKQAIDKAVAFLSTEQTDEGGFDDEFVGGISSEATSQVIIGLTAVGIEPTGDAFTKQGGHLLDHLLSFQVTDGGFKHVRGDSSSNAMATEQALQALVAYKRFIEGAGRLYDFTEEPIKPSIVVNGLKDGMTVTNADLTFTVSAVDGNGDSIVPTVTWNDKPLAPYENDTYSVTLSEGNNAIDITATDEHGEKAERTFTVVYALKKNPEPEKPNAQLPIKHPEIKPEQPVAGQRETISRDGTDASGRTTLVTDDRKYRLPDTATQSYNALLIGCLLLTIGVVLWMRQNRKKHRV